MRINTYLPKQIFKIHRSAPSLWRPSRASCSKLVGTRGINSRNWHNCAFAMRERLWRKWWKCSDCDMCQKLRGCPVDRFKPMRRLYITWVPSLLMSEFNYKILIQRGSQCKCIYLYEHHVIFSYLPIFLNRNRRLLPSFSSCGMCGQL